MSDAAHTSDLLAFALLDVDERAQQLRSPLHVFLVSIALFTLEAPASTEEIVSAVAAEMPAGNGLSRGEVEQALAVSRKAGFIEDSGDNKVQLTSARREQLSDACARINDGRREFHNHLRERVEHEAGSLEHEQAAKLEEEVDLLVQRVFQRSSVELSRSFGPNGGGFGDAGDEISVKGLKALASEVVPPSESLRRAQVAVGLREGLQSLPVASQRYLAAMYQKTIAFALLQQDPSIRRVKRSLAEKRIAYLDTNVLMAYLFEAHRRHAEAVEVVESARKVGAKLRVSKFTVDELEVQLEESHRRFQRLGPGGKSLGEVVDDDVIRTFSLRRKQSPGLTWTAYIAEFRPVENALLEAGFEASDPGSRWAEAVHDDRLGDVVAAVRVTKPPHMPQQVIDFDARNITFVQILRRQAKADEMGNRLWLVTLDRGLKDADRRLLKDGIFLAPSTMRADSWSSHLTPHLSPEDSTLQGYVTHLVQSQVGVLAEDPAFIDTNFLITLEESPLDTRSLLAGAPEKTRRVLTAVQAEREVKAVLEEPPDDATESEEWAEKLSEAVKKSIEELGDVEAQKELLRETAEERDRALVAEQTVRRERDQSLREVAALLHQMESTESERKSLLQRFLELLRSKPPTDSQG